MTKLEKRALVALVIIVMLGTSPLSVTYSFGDIKKNQDKKSANWFKRHSK